MTLTGSGSYGNLLVSGSLSFEAQGPNFGNAANANIWLHDNQAQVAILNNAYDHRKRELSYCGVWQQPGVSCEANTVTLTDPVFHGSIAGTVLTVADAPINGSVAVGQSVRGTGVLEGTIITSLGTGTGGVRNLQPQCERKRSLVK